MKKSVFIILIVLFTIINQGFTANITNSDYNYVKVVDGKDQIIIRPSGELDDPQPDTLKYDDGTGAIVVTGEYDYYAGVRFTAPSDFEVRSIYLRVSNPNNNQIDDLIITICADSNGIPGTVLDNMVIPAPIGQGWLAVNLNTPLIFEYGEDFHVYHNAPGGMYSGDLGWWCSLDQISNIYRTLISNDGVTWNESPYDCLIRAGGEFSGTPEPLIELSTTNIVFDSTLMGETDIESITIINPSMLMNLTIAGIEIDETIPPGVFNATFSTPPIIIMPLCNLEIPLEFSPSDTGFYSSIMRIESDSPDSLLEVQLSGEGLPFPLISMEPVNPPIQIPAGGGFFDYDLEIVNGSLTNFTIDVSIDVTLPGGTTYPVSSKIDINLHPGASVLRSLTQFIPGGIQTGIYLYNGYIYDHNTWELISEDSFQFEKLAGDDSPNHNLGWALYGWDGDFTESENPQHFSLITAHPNPFNNQTTISFNLPTSGNVSLKIFDITGREVAALYAGHWALGQQSVVWNAEGMSSGVYFVRMEAGDFVQTQKILLLK